MLLIVFSLISIVQDGIGEESLSDNWVTFIVKWRIYSVGWKFYLVYYLIMEDLAIFFMMLFQIR